MIAAAGMALAPVANAASAPVPARVASQVTDADSEHIGTPMAAILVILVFVLIALAGVSGGGEPASP